MFRRGSFDIASKVEQKKLLIVMVGLPARGKSFISHRLTNYLTWSVSFALHGHINMH